MEALAVLFVLYVAAVYCLTFIIGSAGFGLWAGTSAWRWVRMMRIQAAGKRQRQHQAEQHAQAVRDYRRPYDAHRSAENLAYWRQRLEQEQHSRHA